MQGSQNQAKQQQQQKMDYLNAAIKAKQNNDEQAYKQNYLNYLIAKQKSDAASGDDGSSANKNDSQTQLYLAAERLVQSDPEVRDASKALALAQSSGDPQEVTAAQAQLRQIMQAKQAQHWAALGLNPKAAVALSTLPGNSQANPIDAGKMGITAKNIAQKLRPGQYFINPTDHKVYQYNGPSKQGLKPAPLKRGITPSPPGPINPMKPYQTPLDSGDDSGD